MPHLSRVVNQPASTGTILPAMRSRTFPLFAFVLLASLACRSIATPTPAPSPVPTGSPAPIPVSSPRFPIAALDDAGNIQLLTPEGDALPLTSDASATLRYQHLTWSPDGARLAYVQSYLFGDSLIIHDLATDTTQTVFTSEEEYVIYVYWSPNETQLSFLTGGGLPADLELYLADLSSGEVRTLAQAQPLYWAFSPSGDDIALHLNSSMPEASLNIVAASNPTTGTQLVDQIPGLFQSPAWHPDGQTLFTATSDSIGHTQILRFTPGQEPNPVYGGFGRVAFSPSPDGEYLALIEFPDPNRPDTVGSLRVISLSSNETVVSLREASYLAFFWSPDSSHLLYFSLDSSPENEQQGDSTRHAKPLAQAITLSAYVVAIRDGNSTRLATGFQPAQEFAQMLLFFDQYARSHTLWSPDSSAILLSGVSSSGEAMVWLYDAANVQPPRLLLAGIYAIFSPIPTP